MLTLTTADGVPYSLKVFLDSCYIKNGADTVGYVQGLSKNGDQLIIDHFAVEPRRRKDVAADAMIRAFAKLVKDEMDDVSIITFDLGRATSDSDIQTLADAREALLNRIGAVNVKQTRPNPNCIVVSGHWHKEKW